MGILKALFYLSFLVFPFGVLLRVQLTDAVTAYVLDIVVLLISVVFFIRYRTRAKEFYRGKNFLPLLALIIVFIISLFLSPLRLTNSEFFSAGMYIVRFIIFANLLFILKSFDDVLKKTFSMYLAISGFFLVMFGYLQYMFYPDLRNLYYLGWDEHLYRMFSTMLDPNFAGALFIIEFFLLLDLLLESGKRRYLQLATGIALILTAGAIFLTYSRSSLIAFVAASVFYLLTTQRKRLVFFFVFCFIVAFILLPKNFGGEGVRIFRTASIAQRYEEYQQAMQVVLMHPVSGVGYNAYRYAQERYFNDHEENINAHALAGVPNSYLYILATTGFVGIVAFFFAIKTIFLSLYSRKKMVICAALVGLLVHSLFENTLFYNFVLFMFFVGIGVKLEED